MFTCTNKTSVLVRNRSDIEAVEITVNCGDLVAASSSTKAALCDICLTKANKLFPQGWKYSPGDICKHGTYVGGDRDCACSFCERE